jgi:RHH-type transcriptional regulator, proline utilization regulon repressor / proline dehydrogenase / delta 1-pyrroline-5-carboxylate dehydrogenase
VFGPVLHVLRYRRADLDALIAAINGTGYGLTFGLHTRIEETVTHVLGRVSAGNLYVNRTVIGAVVGVQPFGGGGLSGTGPKAGGPRFLARLTRGAAPGVPVPAGTGDDPEVLAYAGWLRRRGRADLAARVEGYGARAPLGLAVTLPGPVGERNTYSLHPRGRIAALAASEAGTLLQIGAILATGQTALVPAAAAASGLLDGLPALVGGRIVQAGDPAADPGLGGVLHEGDRDSLTALARRLAAREGGIVPLWSIPSAAAPGADYEPADLLEERAVSVNTAAAGGNASLMALEA